MCGFLIDPRFDRPLQYDPSLAPMPRGTVCRKLIVFGALRPDQASVNGEFVDVLF
jgi:hypothetical protein